VVKAAHDLGVTSALPEGAPSLPLGTATLTLEELAGAYAAFALGRYPVVPHGRLIGAKLPAHRLDERREWAPMLDLLWSAANEGTGQRAANLRLATFGKTGTSQDGRDALFVGFSGDLVTAIWIGRDDNKPVPGASGGHLPARVWANFMRGIPLKPLDIPSPPRASRIQRLWGAEDTPGYEEDAEESGEPPLIELPVGAPELPPQGEALPPLIAPEPVGPPPPDEAPAEVFPEDPE
jgi:penicillin-binding protein 1A